jgi:chromosome segregation ATPase
MFLAKSRGTSESHSKLQETSASPAAAAQQSVNSSTPSLGPTASSTGAPPLPSKLQPAPSDAPAHEDLQTTSTIAPPSPAATGLPSSPFPVRAAHASIFSSPLTGSSAAASSAGDTALLSAQVADLRRRVAECERDRDLSSQEHSTRMREALDAAAASRLELQGVRDRAFEDNEALRFQHEQASDSLRADIARLQQANDSLQAEKSGVEQRLLCIEATLTDALSRRDAAQEELLEQAALRERASAREEELQTIITTQTQEISSWSSKYNSSLAALQQCECDFQEKIQAHTQEANALRSQITVLSAELKDHLSLSTELQREIEALRNARNEKANDDCNAAAAEVMKLRALLQESSDVAAVSLSKVQSDCASKEHELDDARHQLAASQAAVAEAHLRECDLNLQVQALQSQLTRKLKDIQEQKSVLGSPVAASPGGDSVALDASTRRAAEIERK